MTESIIVIQPSADNNVAKATVLVQARSQLNGQIHKRLSVEALKHFEYNSAHQLSKLILQQYQHLVHWHDTIQLLGGSSSIWFIYQGHTLRARM